MSTLKVNEIDSKTGTTITVAAGKTLAGTDIIDTAQIAADAITAAEIETGAVGTTELGSTLDLSGKTLTLPATLPATIGTNITQLPGANITGTIPLAALGNAPATDLTPLEDDIALLGFRVASNGSLAKYNLDDQTVDAFEDASGIDAGSSTGEARSASGKYYYGASSVWETGDRTSTITVTSDANTFYEPASARTGAAGVNQQLVDGNFTNNTTYSLQWWNNQGATSRDLRFDLGSEKVVTDAKYYQSGTNVQGTWEWHASNDNWNTYVTIGSTFTLGGATEQTYAAQLGANTTAYRYWKYRGTAGSMSGAPWVEEVEFKVDAEGANMVLVSTTTAANAAPTKGDIVFTYTTGTGSTTLGTDVTAEISADGGSTWTAMTLGSEGSTGSHNIAASHDVTITSTITAPWNMAYRIKTLNQSASKTTRIQAVSLGWS